MKDRKAMDTVQEALDTALAELKDDPWLAQRVLTKAKGGQKVKKKISVGLVLALALILAAVTALAVGLTNYFAGFAALENTYGEYEQWPGSAKVKLVQLMLDNGVMPPENAAAWADALPEQEREAAAEEMLSQYFSGMDYVDTYNAMVRELGPIEQWSDEERALYTGLLEQYGKLTDAWPVYQMPKAGGLSRQQAISQARDAILNKFSVTAKALDALTVDAIFAANAHNPYGVPGDEPFWIVEFGYGYAYRAYMTKNGEMLGIMGPQTQFLRWERDILDGAREATPGIHDATREEAVQSARSALTEVQNLSQAETQGLDAAARFIYDDRYCDGDEPVWVVSWSRNGQVLWNVLLGYDGSYIDAEPAGKVFDRVMRADQSLADLWRERCGELGMTEYFNNKNGDYYYNWSLEEKAAFSKMWIPIVQEYEATHPYCHEHGSGVWEWTRNVNGLPDAKAIPQEQAVELALQAIRETFGDSLSAEEMSVFYYVTNPEKPEWRIVNATRYVTVDAYTGTVLLVERNAKDGPYQTISDFLAQ